MRKGLLRELTLFILYVSLALIIVGGGCSSPSEAIPTPSPTASPVVTPTPTLTPTPLPAAPTPTPTPLSGKIEIISSSTEADFPESITFSLETKSPGEINQIALRYKVRKVSLAQVATEVEPEFDESDHVAASWTWDTRKAPLPPGAEIQYQWLVEDSEGRKTQSTWATFVFQDLRYNWSTISEGDVTLFWYNGDQSLAQQLIDAAQGGLDKLAADTGAHLDKAVKIYVYGSHEDLIDALIYPQAWTGGVAFTEYGILAIGIPPESLEWGKGAMVHELAHLVTYQMTVNPYGDIPTWLDEGISMYAEGTLEEEYQTALTEAISGGELISMQSLSSGYPTNSEEACLLYAESHSVVDFLIHTYGRDKMLELLEVFKEGASYDSALLKVYSFDTKGLEARWHTYIGAG